MTIPSIKFDNVSIAHKVGHDRGDVILVFEACNSVITGCRSVSLSTSAVLIVADVDTRASSGSCRRGHGDAEDYAHGACRWHRLHSGR